MTVYTTLNKIRAFKPSILNELLDRLGKTLPDDEPLPLVHVLNISGLDEALWLTFTVSSEHRKKIIDYTIRCAESGLHNFEKQFPNELAPRLAIQAARDYLHGNYFAFCYFWFKSKNIDLAAKEVAQFTTWKAKKAADYMDTKRLRFYAALDFSKQTQEREEKEFETAKVAAEDAKAAEDAARAAWAALRVTSASMPEAYFYVKDAAKAAGAETSRDIFREIFGGETL